MPSDGDGPAEGGVLRRLQREEAGGRLISGPHPSLRWNRSLQLLWAGSAASSMGSAASGVAFPLLILAMTGSAALAGLSAAAGVAAGLIFGLPGGALTDRWDHRRLLIGVETVRTINAVVLARSTVYRTIERQHCEAHADLAAAHR